MKKEWFLIGSFVLGAPLGVWANSIKMDPPPKVEESNHDADKAAVSAASSEADQWAAKAVKQSSAPTTIPVESPKTAPSQAPVPAPAPAPALAPVPVSAPATPAPPHRSGLNEMKGKLQSLSSDSRTLRLLVEGGYNVEFTFDGKSAVSSAGSSIHADDLNYGDELVVRYAGKELYAVEIERLSAAARPQ